MNVSELILQLEKFPPWWPVAFMTSEDGDSVLSEIHDAEQWFTYEQNGRLVANADPDHPDGFHIVLLDDILPPAQNNPCAESNAV